MEQGQPPSHPQSAQAPLRAGVDPAGGGGRVWREQ
jgi:hypothetical protein